MSTSESVVVELLAKVDGFDGKVRGSAASFGTSMKQIEQSAGSAEAKVGTAMVKVDKALAQSAQRSRLLGYQIADVGAQLAAGQSPFLIIAQQAPQVANALDGATGAVGKFATFLSGPWGAAMLAAGSILSVFAADLIKTGDSVDDLVDKLKEQEQKTQNTEKANATFADTLEGVEKALRDNREAMEKLNLVQDTSAESALKAADAARVRAIRIREVTVALLEQAKAEFASSREINFGAGGAASAGITQAIFAKRVTDIEELLKKAERDLANARGQTIEARAAVVVERAMASAEDKINARYDAQIDGAKKAAIASGKVGEALRKEVEAINRAREAELKRYRDTEAARRKAERSGSSSLPQVTGREIANALGTTITSGQRSAQRNKDVGGSKNSYHLTGQAIDIPLTVNGKPLTKAGIRAALEPLGVQIKELLGPGDKNHNDHFHIAFSKKRLGPDQIASQQQREAEAAEKAIADELRRRQSFENELANLTGSEIDARQALVTSAEEIAKLELDAIELSRAKYDDNLNALVEQKKLTDEEANQLRAINDERANLRAELVKRREDERKFRMAEAEAQRRLAAQLGTLDVEGDLLQSQEGIARTAKERKQIGERLIDIGFEEERLQLQAVIAQADRLKIELERISTLRKLSDAEKEELKRAQDAADDAKRRLGTLPQRKANAQTSNAQQNMSPLESFFDGVPETADEINEALENIAANGLANFTDALTDAIVNFRSLGDAGRAVLQALTADIVKLAIKMLLLKAIKGIFGIGFSGGGSVDGKAAGGLIGFASGGRVGFPTGGFITGPGTGTSDSILAAGPGRPIRVSNGEYIIRAASVRKLGRPFLDQINANGQMPLGYARGGALVPVRPTNAPVSGVGRSGSDLSPDSVRQLESIVSRAVEAMPDVKLYPTLSPSSVLRSALSDPGGRKAMFDFLAANSGKANGALGA